MSTARKEEIIKKGFIKSLLEGTLEIKDLAGININLDIARQAYLQGVQETTKTLIELVEENIATAAGQALQATAAKQDEIKGEFGKSYMLTASDEIQLEDNSTNSNASQTWSKGMQFTILTPGMIRIKAQIKATSPAECWAQVRVNAVDRGDQWGTAEETYQDVQMDIGVGIGDLVQIWFKTEQDGYNAWLRYGKICCDQSLGITPIGVVS